MQSMQTAGLLLSLWSVSPHEKSAALNLQEQHTGHLPKLKVN